ncbi:MAG: hypothetical protein ACXWDM_14580, partial [Nocardioides sp.]
HLTGELDDRPVVTFSAEDPSRLEPGRPAPAYLATMARGLRSMHGLTEDEVVDYLLAAVGIGHDSAALLDAVSSVRR